MSLLKLSNYNKGDRAHVVWLKNRSHLNGALNHESAGKYLPTHRVGATVKYSPESSFHHFYFRS